VVTDGVDERTCAGQLRERVGVALLEVVGLEAAAGDRALLGHPEERERHVGAIEREAVVVLAEPAVRGRDRVGERAGERRCGLEGPLLAGELGALGRDESDGQRLRTGLGRGRAGAQAIQHLVAVGSVAEEGQVRLEGGGQVVGSGEGLPDRSEIRRGGGGGRSLGLRGRASGRLLLVPLAGLLLHQLVVEGDGLLRRGGLLHGDLPGRADLAVARVDLGVLDPDIPELAGRSLDELEMALGHRALRSLDRW